MDWTPVQHARQTPDHPAIVMGGSGAVTTYAELDDRSARLAQALRERGLREGDHIAVLMENNAAYLEVCWAAQRSGLYYTAINRHLRPAEVQYVLDDCDAAAVVTSPVLGDVIAGLHLSRIPTQISVGAGLPGFETYAALVESTARIAPADEREGREMLYSSGTTGKPKGVRKSLPGLPFGDPRAEPVLLAQALGRYGVGSHCAYLSPAPLYHSAPLVFSMSMLRAGATVVVMEHFDPLLFLQLIERHRVTHTQVVPTMFVRLLQLSDEERARYDLSSLVQVVHGAAPCPVHVKHRMLEWLGPIIHEYYSGTEAVGDTSITPQEWLAHPGSVGRPRQECHIVDEDGNELPPGESGLIYFSGGAEFEYHNDAEKTASIANDKGWRTLGDIGYLDGDGYLYLTDRKSHMIVSGGVNIYPQEAENALLGHRAIADVAVIGVPDDEMGEAVKAVVQLRPGIDGTEDLARDIIAFCTAEVATYKCPRTVDFVAELPRDDNGKLYKRLVREQYWQGHDSRVV